MKMKALVAAVALISGVAHADIVNVFNTAAPGSLLLGLYNPTAGVSSLYDLGLDTSSFSFANVGGVSSSYVGATETLQITWNLNTGTVASTGAHDVSSLLAGVSGAWSDAWTAYQSNATASSFFEVIAGDTTTSAATSSILTTSRTALTAGAGSSVLGTGTNLTQMGSGTSTWLANNVGQGNHATVANGADVITDGSTAYQGNATAGFKDHWTITPNIFNADQTLNNSANFYGLQGVSAGQANKLTDFNGSFAFNAADGTLTYSTLVAAAPVPEASTYAMLLAGLGLMGLMVRRRA
jgi:hypothetical protein